MKNKFFTLLVFLFCINFFGQNNTSVPYRVGNKFGISDLNGKMLIEPKFDIVEVNGYDEIYFKTYSFSNNENQIGIVLKNKLVLNSDKYSNYEYYLDLIIANKYNEKAGEVYLDNVNDLKHLYSPEGKIIIGGNVIDLDLNQPNEKTNSTDVLIHTVKKDNSHSLYLYNKFKKVITKTYFVNSINFDFYYNEQNSQIVYYYKDVNKISKKLTLDVVNGKVKVIALENGSYSNVFDSELASDTMSSGYVRDSSMPSNAIIDIPCINLVTGNFYKSKVAEKIEIRNRKLNPDYSYLLVQDNKKGLFDVKVREFKIPQAYDEIFESSFSGIECYVLKNANTYGLYVNKYSSSFIVKEVFDKIPLIENLNYFGENNPLIKLYDENNTFFCFADKTGKLFYSEK